MAVGFLVALVIAFVWSGFYNVAANDPHWGVTVQLVEKLRDRSITVRSKAIVVPTSKLEDAKLVERGFRHYHATCRLCHGAPGYSRNEFAKGLNPHPPDLVVETVQKRKTAEQYWIIKNGIKMTGMPAFDKTHDDDEIWEITVFLRRLPSLQSKEYNAMVKASTMHDGGEVPHHHK